MNCHSSSNDRNRAISDVKILRQEPQPVVRLIHDGPSCDQQAQHVVLRSAEADIGNITD